MQWFLIRFFPYKIFFVNRISKRMCVANLTAIVVLVFSMKSRKRGTEFGAVLNLVHKEAVLPIQDDRIFQYFAFSVYTAYTVLTIFKGHFLERTVLKLLKCCCFIVLLAPIVYHIANGIQTVNGKVFSILKFALIWNLLSMPIAQLSLIFMGDICLFHSKVFIN